MSTEQDAKFAVMSAAIADYLSTLDLVETHEPSEALSPQVDFLLVFHGYDLSDGRHTYGWETSEDQAEHVTYGLLAKLQWFVEDRARRWHGDGA